MANVCQTDRPNSDASGGEGGSSDPAGESGSAGYGDAGGPAGGEGGTGRGAEGGASGESGANDIGGAGGAGEGGSGSTVRPDSCRVDVPCLDRDVCPGYWKADEGSGTVLLDSSPRMYDGTISAGGTWAPGWHGLGLSLSTGNEYAEVPHGSQIKGVNPFTVSVWLKPAEINRLQYLVKKARLNATIGDIPYDGYELGLEANGKPFFRINQVTSLDTYRLDAIQPVLLDEWTHVAATYDFSVARLYVDGVEVASGRFDVPVLGNPVRLGIGAECRFNTRCSPAAATNFKGILDEIRFLQTVLPARDIAILARRGPVISWSFDEDPLLTGGRARDESGACNDGELLDGADVLGIGCRPGHGGCLSLDGNTVSVDLDWDSRLEGSFTAAAWVQRNVSGTTNVISQSDEENGFAVGIDPNGYAFASVGAPPGGVAFSVTGLTPQAEGVWRHLAATFDGLSLSLYENGLLQAVVPAAGATLTSGVPLSLGSRTQGASPLTARMDDVRVYRRALALEEIADLP